LGRLKAFITPLRIHIHMVNYYSMFGQFKEQRNLSGRILLDQFEKEMSLFFGLGEKSARRWLANFQNVGLIKINKDVDGVWFVEVL